MEQGPENVGRGVGKVVRVVLWGGAGFLLLIPLLLNFPWTAFDFVFAAVLIGGTGLLFELVLWASRSFAYRAAAGFALAACFLTVWVNGAVGMIGSEDNSYNLLFLGVIVLAAIGAVVARFRAGGMALAMAVAAVAQLGVAAGGVPMDLRGALFSAVFAGFWLIAAALFRKAATAPAAQA